MKEASIIGPYTIHNFGDDLIGAVIAKELNKKGYHVSIPGFTEENSRWLNLENKLSIKDAVKKADTVIIGGGGLFGDAGVSPKDTYREFCCKAAIDAKLRLKRVLSTGIGAGPLTYKKSYLLTYLICLLSEKIGVRDSESVRFLHKIGVLKKKIIEGADVALLSPDYLVNNVRKNNKIGIQFDVMHFVDIVKGNNEIRTIFNEVDGFVKQNANDAMLITNGRNRSQLLLMNDGIGALCYKGYLPDFIDQLAGIDAIFTSHLHLAITAYAYRIPCFSLYVREKTKRFYDQIGHPERAIDLKTATVQDCKSLLSQLKTVKWTDFDEQRLTQLKNKAIHLLDII